MSWLTSTRSGRRSSRTARTRSRAASAVPWSCRTGLLDDRHDVAAADRVAGSVTRTSFTVPLLSAPMAFSIFMASSTQIVWPTSTASPTPDQHPDDRALHRDRDRARPGRGRGRAPGAPRRAGAPADGARPPGARPPGPKPHPVEAAVDLGRDLPQHLLPLVGLGLGGLAPWRTPRRGRGDPRPSGSSASPRRSRGGSGSRRRRGSCSRRPRSASLRGPGACAAAPRSRSSPQTDDFAIRLS